MRSTASERLKEGRRSENGTTCKCEADSRKCEIGKIVVEWICIHWWKMEGRQRKDNE
jgi:hypothetical protein